MNRHDRRAQQSTTRKLTGREADRLAENIGRDGAPVAAGVRVGVADGNPVLEVMAENGRVLARWQPTKDGYRSFMGNVLVIGGKLFPELEQQGILTKRPVGPAGQA